MNIRLVYVCIEMFELLNICVICVYIIYFDFLKKKFIVQFDIKLFGILGQIGCIVYCDVINFLIGDIDR